MVGRPHGLGQISWWEGVARLFFTSSLTRRTGRRYRKEPGQGIAPSAPSTGILPPKVPSPTLHYHPICHHTMNASRDPFISSKSPHPAMCNPALYHLLGRLSVQSS